MSEDRTQHELLKREMKKKIIDLSIQHSIVTQFTSFVAIEKREDGEIFDKTSGPSIDELLSEEDVDFLSYMAYSDDMDEDVAVLSDFSGSSDAEGESDDYLPTSLRYSYFCILVCFPELNLVDC